MDIMPAWEHLSSLSESDSPEIKSAARWALVEACEPMKKRTARKSCCQLPPYFFKNEKENLYAECDVVVLEACERLILKDPTLTSDNPPGFLKSGMYWACYDWISDELKRGIKDSEPYAKLADEFPSFEEFDIAIHDTMREDCGLALIDSNDSVNAAFSTPLAKMIIADIRDSQELNFTQTAKNLGIDPATVKNIFNEGLNRMRAEEGNYCLGA